jgi:hypothetical protein
MNLLRMMILTAAVGFTLAACQQGSQYASTRAPEATTAGSPGFAYLRRMPGDGPN